MKGHKIGLTSKAMREPAGPPKPDYGTLFDDWFILEGGVVPRSQMNRPLVEAELAFVLRAAGRTGRERRRRDPGDRLRVPCLEVVDVRQKSRGRTRSSTASPTPPRAAGSSSAAARPADRRRHPPDRGEPVDQRGVEQSGVASAVMGNPINAVLAGEQAPRVRCGAGGGPVILSGSFIKAIPFAPGDTVVRCSTASARSASSPSETRCHVRCP